MRRGLVRAGAERLLQAGVLLLPLACWPNLPHPFSTPKTWLLGLLALCALAALPPDAHRPSRAGDWLWLLWPAALATTALIAAFPGFEALLLAALPLPLAWAIHRGAVPVAPLRRALVMGSAVESAIACLQYTGLDPLQWLGWQPESFTADRMRVYGTMGNPDFVAAWLCATLPLYAGARGPALLGAALQLAAIFATGSRVFLLALPIAAFALWSHRLKKNPWRTHSCVPRRVSLDALCRPLILAGVAAAILYCSPARPIADTIRGRWYLTSIAVAHWREVPLTGLGPGSVEIHFAPWQAATRESRFAGAVDHIHNDYVEFWVEYGPVGLGAFLALSLWLVAGNRPWAMPEPGDADLRGCIASLALIAWVDFPFHRPAEWGLYWILLAALSLRRNKRIDPSPN